MHSYSLPKGLHALKKQQRMSESEYYDKDRYSKRNILTLEGTLIAIKEEA